jgi:hypothetical protein
MLRPVASVLLASVLLTGAALALIGCAQQPASPAPAPPPPQGVYVPGFGPETRPSPPPTAAERGQTAPAPASVPRSPEM